MTMELSPETAMAIDAFKRHARAQRRVEELERDLHVRVTHIPADEFAEYVRATTEWEQRAKV